MEYKHDVGDVFYRRKHKAQDTPDLIRCVITKRSRLSKGVGGVYDAVCDYEVGNMDCNWSYTYSKNTFVCDKNYELDAEVIDGKIIMD